MNVISGLRNSGFLAQSACSAAVATKDELGRDITATYLTAHQSLEGYATEQFVEDTSASITALIPTDYYPNSNPSGFITGVDLSNYYQKNETSSKEEISAAIAAIPLGDVEVNQAVHTNSATWNTVTDKLDLSAQVISSCETSSILATTIPFISFKTLVTKLNGYEVSAGYAGSANIANVATKDYQGNTIIASYAKASALNDKLDTTSFSEVSGSFLTAHQSLDGYATETLVEETSGAITSLIPTDYYPDTNPSGFISGVPNTYLQNTDLTIVDNKVTEISGVPLSAGDEFPVSADEAVQYVQSNSGIIDDTVTSYQTNSGTFLTAHQAISAEEWNSNYETVNTNSGVWGGSALPISAGPGIKFNLVDNTLVFSNDETVLFDGTATSASWPITLSESISNFESFKIEWCPYTEDTNWEAPYDVVNTKLYNGTIHLFGQGLDTAGAYGMLSNLLISANDDKLTKQQFISMTMYNSNVAVGKLEGYRIYKVIGINRIGG